MTKERRVVILGGHGKVALLATSKLRQAGYAVDSVIRDPGQAGDVAKAGGHPVVMDLESASVDDFANAFADAEAIVFAAGAGGKGPPERTRVVDYEAAKHSMQAAARASVPRYIMVSYARAADQYAELDPEDDFYTYAKAKHDADVFLRESTLDYTILGPGALTLDGDSRKLRIADAHGAVDGEWPADANVTSRANVAEVITHVIANHAAARRTVNFYDGEVPLEVALMT